MKILITGATGFIGKEIGKYLSDAGHEVFAVTRNAKQAQSILPYSARVIEGDLNKAPLTDPSLSEIEAVIHLAGESVGTGRWTTEKKRAIFESRKVTTQNLLASLRTNQKLSVFVSASAIGIYGDTKDTLVTETSPRGTGFLAEVCESWEKQTEALPSTIRRVTFRIGVVLGPFDGALMKILMPFQMGVGGPIGTGKQWMSWIHIHDLVKLFSQAVTDQNLSGVYNAVAPEPVTNQDLSKHVAKIMGQKIMLPVPGLALKIALGEQASIVLDSQRVSSLKLKELGFAFQFRDIQAALTDCLTAYANGDRIFYAEQFLPIQIDQVFQFFSDPNNLEKITPELLRFHIESCSTPKVEQGSLINYRLRVHGVPIRWQTLIDRWSPPNEFVDTQIKGPYAKWHHTHSFKEVRGGTLMTDLVRYRLPLGLLGSVSGGWLVEKDVRTIFSFRRSVISKLISPTN